MNSNLTKSFHLSDMLEVYSLKKIKFSGFYLLINYDHSFINNKKKNEKKLMFLDSDRIKYKIM
jgi:hypothetical protein